VVGYTINPPLPAGLLLNPMTGIISGTPTGIPSVSSFRVTAYNQFGATSTTLSLARDVLMVVGSLSLNAGDTSLRNWFHSAGYVVTLRTLVAAQAADAFAKDLVMITATGTSTQLGSRLRDVPVPVIVCESGLFDDMGLTAAGEGVNFNNSTAQTQINVRTPAHPLAAGLTGLTTVISGAGQVFNWGVPGAEAIKVASLAADAARSTLFGYEIGSRLASGQTVVHRRLGMFLHDLTPNRLNAQGLQILAAAVRWAIEGSPQNTQPSGLSYSSNPAFYNLNVAITPNIPTPVGGLPASYSISPLLPAGMVLNPTTGVISGTPSVVKKETRYQVTASNSTGSSSTTLTLSVEGPGDILLVVGSLSLNAGDQAVRDWFVVRGYSVSVRTLAEVQAADTTGNDLVVVTSTGTSGQIGSRLRDVAVPVIVSEPYSLANMGMTLTGDNVQMGIANLETQLNVVGTGHPLAAGLSGLTSVASNSAGFLSWGIPGSAAEKIATLPTNSARAPLFAYELGSLMASGQCAPGRRVGLFLGDLTAASFTPQGLQLFSAAVQWSLEEPVFDSNGPPVLLRYATNPAVYLLNSRIDPNLPSSLGGPVNSYSIMPALPVGLVLDPVTGIISGRPKEVKPPTTYLVTATNLAGSTTLQLPISISGPPPGDVLLVVGNSSLNAGDASLRNWFLAGGYTVTVRTLSAVQATDTVGMELVMITSTGTAGQISTRLRDVPVPVIVSEPFAFGNMRMTLPGDNVQMGFASNETQISVAASSHPLTVGLGGLTTVVSNSAGFFGWGVPGSNAFNIATLAANPSRSALFAYDSGSLLATGDVAPHRRLGMFLGDLTAANFTLEGSWILAAAVDWAIKGIVVVAPDPPPNPPTALTYPSNPATYQVSGAITPNVPTSQGGTVQSYSITPALPAGLVFNTTTGVISGTPTEIRAAAPYQVTASNEDGATSVSLTLSVPGPPEVMLVVGNLTLNTGDTALRNWFLTRGYVVTMRTFAAAQAADATGKNLVVVSSTGTSTQLGGRLTNVAVPVIVCESAIFDDMGMTAVGDGVQHGTLNLQSQIQITSPSHPLAAGLSGLTTVASNSAGFFQWGVPGSTAVNVAALASNPARSTLFAYERGSVLVSGQPAAHRRLGLFLGDFTAANFTASGSQIFGACVQWAVGQR
jgi:Putative Ig domain